MLGQVEPILRGLDFLGDEIVDATLDVAVRHNARILLCSKIACKSADHTSIGILLSRCVRFPISEQDAGCWNHKLLCAISSRCRRRRPRTELLSPPSGTALRMGTLPQ